MGVLLRAQRLPEKVKDDQNSNKRRHAENNGRQKRQKREQGDNRPRIGIAVDGESGNLQRNSLWLAAPHTMQMPVQGPKSGPLSRDGAKMNAEGRFIIVSEFWSPSFRNVQRLKERNILRRGGNKKSLVLRTRSAQGFAFRRAKASRKALIGADDDEC